MKFTKDLVHSRNLTRLVALLLSASLSNTLLANAQTRQTNTSGTDSRKFGYVITNNYGVSVTSTQTPGYDMEGEATMGILPGSYIKNKSSPSGVTMRRNGITVTGIQTGMELNLDPDKTRFWVRLKSPTGENIAPASTNSVESTSGTASISATGSTTTTFSVENSESINNSSFTKTF